MEMKGDSTYTNSDIAVINGLGTTYTKAFYQKGIKTLFDLLLDFPFKYFDKTKIQPIAKINQDGAFYQIDAHIIRSTALPGKKILKLLLQDESGTVEAIFFNLYPNQISKYQVQRRVLLFGQIKYNNFENRFCFNQPTITFLDENDVITPHDTLTPVYHAVKTTPQKTIRKSILGLLDKIKLLPLEELLPKEHNPFTLSINTALEKVHYPTPQEFQDAHFAIENTPAFKRLCYEELVAYQLSLLSIKERNLKHNAIVIPKAEKVIKDFQNKLPFKLTGAQLHAYEDIQNNLSSNKPMLRLVHGDVGSGKTLVAIMAMLQVAMAQHQSVMLAPTELLAIQHYHNVTKYLKDYNIKITLLTSSLSVKDRKTILKDIASGEILIIIGTHSVFQNEVIYKSLVLAIIDEQHRFGTDQRMALLRKAPADYTMHQLVMTATPIPRTLQLALFSDLDVSTINEMPKGRQPVTTTVIKTSRKPDLIQRLEKLMEDGTQVYWVCPSIEDNEDENASVKATYKELQQSLPNYSIALLYGQLAPKDKDKIMKDFLERKYALLVATTIIEVGVDVPNASVIIIEDADRLGLAQLHQLRGRVGRGGGKSYCILMYQDKQGPHEEIAQKRLSIMRETSDGFTIAQEDLKLRGPGEVLGRLQSGFSLFKIVDVNRDFELIDTARKAAQDIIKNNRTAANALLARWFPKFKV